MPGFPVFVSSLRGLAVLGGLVALVGCSSFPALQTSLQTSDSFLGVVTPYRMEIVQGNVVTKEAAALAKPGMSRQQVREALGSPMLADAFHADRWDYVFTIRRQGTPEQRRTVVAWFKDDKLDRLEAAELPSEREFVASIFRQGNTSPPPVLELTPEQAQALPRPPKVEAVAAPATGAVRTYPPLEPL
ncbi:MAG: cell envelope protein SmpA [Burkholderiales bacterium PBB5]|jgi:outer membrane protein assembly factor BamE|nr:MAG: cell envelope protein SmpA [Burkholderiales bacterium PBB5]